MMLKLFYVYMVVFFCRGDVINIKFPSNNPCVLADIDATFKLVWVNFIGKHQQIPRFSLADATVLVGVCPNQSLPNVVMQWADGGTFTFSFWSTSTTVSYNWVMRYSPKNVFPRNRQTSTITHSGTFGSSSVGKAFACQHVPVVNNNQPSSGKNTYQLTMTIKSLKAQAYGVFGGHFSDVESCAADIESTTKLTTVTTNSTTRPTAPPITDPFTQTTAPTTPIPAPNAHRKQAFSVYADGSQCVLLDGEFLFTLVYPKKENTKGSVDIGVQNVISVTGDCNSTETNENVVTVRFYDNWVLDLTISKKDSPVMLGEDENTKYYWSKLTLKYDYDTTLGGKPLFPDVDPTITAPELNATLNDGTFEGSTDGSFTCNSNQKIDLGGGNTLQTWNLQYDAFTTSNHTSFSDKNVAECSADSRGSSLVPIVMGCSLGALALPVLIGYLVGRKRKKTYETLPINAAHVKEVSVYRST